MLPSETFIPVARPWLGEEEAAAASRAILSGWVTQGPEVAAFEGEFAAYVGADHACAVANCTVALFLALKACGVDAGSEVVTVSHSYIATANSIRYLGAKPVFVDIEPDTFNIDARQVERAIGPATRAILVVHQMGMPCDLSTLVPLSRARRIPLVEDAACAIGSEIVWDGRWDKIGRPHGDVACFSFHPRKLLTTGDGGMLTTSQADWDARFRLWRQHGMSVSDTVRHSARQVVLESYGEVGYNYRMTDIQAAVGREQLKKMPAMLALRREQAETYRSSLSGVALPAQPAWARTNWQSFCVRLPQGLDQRTVMQALLDEGIATRRGIMCAHREAAYPHGTWSCEAGQAACRCGTSCRRLRQSEAAQDAGLILPLFHGMAQADQETVVAALSRALKRAPG